MGGGGGGIGQCVPGPRCWAVAGLLPWLGDLWLGDLWG